MEKIKFKWVRLAVWSIICGSLGSLIIRLYNKVDGSILSIALQILSVIALIIVCVIVTHTKDSDISLQDWIDGKDLKDD